MSYEAKTSDLLFSRPTGGDTGALAARRVDEFYRSLVSTGIVIGLSHTRSDGRHTAADSKAFYDGVAVRIAGATSTTPEFPDQGKLGMDYSQLIFAPNLAYRLSDRVVIGIAPLLAMHKFSGRGFESFGAFSADPTSVSSRGNDYGVGRGDALDISYSRRL